MRKKLLYTAPDAELLVVRFEENFCGTNDGKGGIQNIEGDDIYDDSGIWSSNN